MNHALMMTGTAALMLTACGSSETVSSKTEISASTEISISNLPADHFDLSHWNITVPLDMDNNKKVDVVSVSRRFFCRYWANPRH